MNNYMTSSMVAAVGAERGNALRRAARPVGTQPGRRSTRRAVGSLLISIGARLASEGAPAPAGGTRC
jgi:hypothetical protein